MKKLSDDWSPCFIEVEGLSTIFNRSNNLSQRQNSKKLIRWILVATRDDQRCLPRLDDDSVTTKMLARSTMKKVTTTSSK
jgi:hypothetical protein